MPYLEFKGRKFVENYHHTVPHHAFEFDPSLSILPSDEFPSLDGNLLIEGDNLKALKSLLPTHAGKVKCVYIDPPYNTGNEEWIYNDKLTQPQFKEWIGKTVGNPIEDATRHDKWCCMMMPRLFVIKELLAEDGVIFVSIDDNEFHNLKMIMDQVFGGNYISDFVWKSRLSEDSRALKGVSNDHEFILCYGKSSSSRLLGTGIDTTKFSNPDNDPRGDWRSADLTGLATQSQRPNLHYTIEDPNSGIVYVCPPKGWRYEKRTMEAKISEGRVLFPSDPEGRPRHKLFLNEVKSRYKNVSSVILDFSTSDGTREINRILGEGVFAFPKPSFLLCFLIQQATDENDIILDCTAGSSTTAHAVLQLNAEDGGNRRFILTQQKHDSKDDERKQINICQDITRERIKRVIEGTNTPALGGSFSYARLSETPVLGAYRDLDPLPSYEELARTVFYTHTSRASDESEWNRESGFLGECNGEAIFLLYDPHADIELGLERAWLDAWGARDPRFDLVVYAEKFAMHRDDLREWCEKHGKTVKHLLVPYEIK